MDRLISRKLYDRALKSLVAGVNSPVRSFSGVNMPPVFAARAEGQHIFDADGNRYLDFLMSWGAIILGHAQPDIVQAIHHAARKGATYGLSTEKECELAELIKEALPGIEQLRMVNSGTEAVMSALRLARGFTGRAKIIKFDGCYHGHWDGLLVKAGSGLATFGLPASGGVPEGFTAETLVVPFNDLDAVESLAKEHGHAIAAIIVEPIAGNMGVVPPADGFLQGLRLICDRIGALFILDEVMTGFRVAWGGAQRKYGIMPDLTTLGKIIGGGLPVGAFGGRADVMAKLAPIGNVYQAGTMSGNPVVMHAGVAALQALKQANPYSAFEHRSARLEAGLRQAAAKAGVPLQVNRAGAMITAFFTRQPVCDRASGQTADATRYSAFFREMLDRGVLLPPSQWEAAFLCTAHTDADIEHAVQSASEAFSAIAQS